ncbi:uncharacterized protein LOC133303797 [Gastrolobium bilobum]|uniref:uncharacterized protein LOC133303797 n=1 Tax=Gastrolobium bilobum TaxID=150636 RepID=UPI002AB1B9A2|nr:uncharacterized protein LOC133303797 [Gastrolobium bilobum]
MASEKKGFSIGRINHFSANNVEDSYLRMLLTFQKGCTSYDDIRTINGVFFPTFKDAYYSLGLLDDDNEYIDAIKEEFISDDVLYQHRKRIGCPESIKNITLSEIDKVQQSNGKRLYDYPSMPHIITESLHDIQNQLVLDELLYDKFFLEEEHRRLMNSLTNEQKIVYDKIISAVSTGKTFIWNTLSASIRSKGEIVLNVAFSGIASLLLPGGRIAHSRFRIPVQITEDSTCNIKQDSTLAELLCTDKPFGGKVVVLGGDFRQILPVIPHGSRQEIVHATINSSYLWPHCHLLTLTKNMRLSSSNSAQNMMEIKEFSEWLLKVGDGVLGDDSDGESIITIPAELLIKKSNDPLSDMVNFVYPDILDHILDPPFFKERAILTPKLTDVAMLNEQLMSLIPGEEKMYLSSDKVLKQDGNSSLEDEEFSPDILNTFTCSGLPGHKLILKVKIPIMLLSNIDQSRGLCNGT